MQLETASRTDIGNSREINQDSLLVAPELGLFVVADGMGGEKAGDEASAQVIATIRRLMPPLLNGNGIGPASVQAALCTALVEANIEVLEIGRREPEKRGLGSTASILCLRHGLAMLAHVGDSRIYLLRGRRVRQLTRDHTLVWQLYECGAINRIQLETHPERHLLTQCIGDPRSVQVDIFQERTERGDIFMLCSDGLTGYASEEMLFNVMQDEEMSIEAKAQRMLELALEGGGGDNITVVLARVVGLDPEDQWQPDSNNPTQTMETPQEATRTAATGSLAPFTEASLIEEEKRMLKIRRTIIFAGVLLVLLCLAMTIYGLSGR